MNKLFNKKSILLVSAFLLMSHTLTFANSPDYIKEFDSLRAQLACQKDINSAEYKKIKSKLDKFIAQNNIDYSASNRLNDTIRLINEQKYNSAIYELKSLIASNYNTTKCNEFLGDIYVKSFEDYSKAVKYYKQSLKNNSNNISCTYKLAKLYLKNNKNILGLEHLKTVAENTQNPQVLTEIEYILKNKFNPEDKFEANNMYEILGIVYVRLNKKQEAISAFNSALILNPNDLYLKYYLGNLYYSAGEDKNAADVYDDILSDNPSDSGIRTSMAKVLFRDGDLKSADGEYRKILSTNPDSIQALYGLYKVYDRKFPCNEILEKIYSDVPNYKANKSEILRFAKILEQTGDKEAVNKFIAYAKKLDAVEKERIEAEKLRLRQIEEEKQRKIKEQQDRINKLKEQEEIRKAKAEEQKRLREQQRLALIEKAKAEKERKEQLAKQRALALQEEKRRKEEQKKLEQQKILAEKKEREQKLKLKKIEEQEKLKLEQEEKEKQLALEKQKENELKRIEKEKQDKILAEKKQLEYEERLIAQEAQKAKQKDINAYNKAMEMIAKYSEKKPISAQNYIAIANTYKMNGQIMSAIRNYKLAMKLDPANSDIYYNLGLSYMELNSFVTSRAFLVKAVNLDKKNAKAVNLLTFVNQKIVTETINKAFSKFENKEYLDAYDILNAGIKDFNNNSQLYYYRALVADAMNRNGAQIMDLKKSIECDTSNYMAFYQLGKAYEKINDERNALVAYERFLSIEPDEKELVDEIQKKVIKLGEKYY